MPAAAAVVAGLLAPAPLGIAVVGLCALPIARRAARALAGRRFSIDVLDAAAAGILLAAGDVLAAGVSVGLIEAGECVRRRAAGRARHVLRGWMGGGPDGVRVLHQGRERHSALDVVRTGDVAVVYAGESVPVDGLVVSGGGSLDERTWTGEPMPRVVGEGAEVLAGSALYDGRIAIQVVATGDDTRAGRLAVALDEAIAADTRLSDLVARIADRFVLPVLVLGAGVFAVTRDVGRLASVLIIDYATGVRVAVPTAILTTMIRAARAQVVFKSGGAIEQLAGVDTLVFDKTGTLTTGRPTVLEVRLEGDLDRREVLRLAAAAEGHTCHPIAGALRRAAAGDRLDIPAPAHVRYHVGGGVVAHVEGRRVLVGDPQLLDDYDIACPAPRGESSVVLVAVDRSLVARIRLRDPVDGSARLAVAELRRMGFDRLVLATGDHPAAAAAVARQLGIRHVAAALSPQDKVEVVRQVRRDGHSVAVVGDGINDAWAMAEANVGVAVPSSTDLTRGTADVLLLDRDLASLPLAIALARDAMGIVGQNIALVAVPNSAGLALAALGGLSPLMAALVNNGSTLLAAANALRPLTTSRTPRAARARGRA